MGTYCEESEVLARQRTKSNCNYIHKGRDCYPIPVIDIRGRARYSDPEARAAIARELSEAGKVGAFCIVNHGIDDKLLKEFRESADRFFALALEEKMKYAKTPVPGCFRPVGYQGQFKNLTQTAFIVQRREVFEIQGSPAVNRELVPWPASVPSFRGSLEAYAEEMGKLSKWACEVLAEGLGLGPDAFLKQLKGDSFHQQIVTCSYPRLDKQPESIVTPNPIAFGAHSDLPLMNIVLEDGVGGVQVFHDDQWVDVQPIPEGITFFLGDPMECMSNGMYHSLIHRVRAPTSSSRFSCVSTFEPSDKDATVIHPVAELVARSGRAARYVPYNFGGRARSLINQTFNPEIMTKRFMVSDFSSIDQLRNFSHRSGVFHIGSHPLGSVTEGY